MAIDDNRPPYVVFERRPVEDRNASIAAGHFVSKEVDFAIITRPGSHDSLEKEAKIWLSEIREKARKNEGGVPSTWPIAFDAAYKAFLEGEELPVSGTPIKGWPVLSPSAQKDIIASGIRTVEDLAEIPESSLSGIGTGSVLYKQKARAWLEAAKGPGKTTEQLVAQQKQLDELTALTKSLIEENKALRAALPAQNPLLKT